MSTAPHFVIAGRVARPRLVLVPGTRRTASSPWRLRLWESRHPKPETTGEAS